MIFKKLAALFILGITGLLAYVLYMPHDKYSLDTVVVEMVEAEFSEAEFSEYDFINHDDYSDYSCDGCLSFTSPSFAKESKSGVDGAPIENLPRHNSLGSIWIEKLVRLLFPAAEKGNIQPSDDRGFSD